MKNNSYIIFVLSVILLPVVLSAQDENSLIRKGNRLYKQKQFDQSQAEYQKALRQAPENAIANYNLGNTQFRKNNFEDAVKSYDAGLGHSADTAFMEKGLYNKGVAWIKEQKLEESIAAWENALKLDPADMDARENLQKALLEKKKQDQQQKKDQQQQKQQDQKDKQQPKPQQSRLNKQQVEQLLKALTQKEKEVQDKMNQNKTKSLSQPDKDW